MDTARLAERDHELRAALFAIEVTAAGLSHDREQMASGQVDALITAMVAEIRRVRALLCASPAPCATFDLAHAVAPAIACARASGLDVQSSIPEWIKVAGEADRTAQVVVALLDNARRHAPSSPVDVGVALLSRTVLVTVKDRGPGIPAELRGRVFERGVRGADSDGSGLGLNVARRLMREQGGAIAVRARSGGGTTFVLTFRRAPLR